MSTFEKAIPVILQHESGWTVDDGGPTNHGWTLPALAKIGIDITADELRAMTVQRATELYERFYWNGFGEIEDQLVATKMLDMSVNMDDPADIAYGRAVKIVQEALNALNEASIVAEDGMWGPATCNAINACAPDILLKAIKNEQCRFYRSLAAINPAKYGSYLEGWLKRAAWPSDEEMDNA